MHLITFIAAHPSSFSPGNTHANTQQTEATTAPELQFVLKEQQQPVLCFEHFTYQMVFFLEELSAARPQGGAMLSVTQLPLMLH